jgi:hypothetical protein
MAATERSDWRRATLCGRSRRAARNDNAHSDRTRGGKSLKNGSAGPHPQSAREDHISVALTGRGRGQLHRPRVMSTRIRALVHRADGASAITHRVIYKEVPGRQR